MLEPGVTAGSELTEGQERPEEDAQPEDPEQRVHEGTGYRVERFHRRQVYEIQTHSDEKRGVDERKNREGPTEERPLASTEVKQPDGYYPKASTFATQTNAE